MKCIWGETTPAVSHSIQTIFGLCVSVSSVVEPCFALVFFTIENTDAFSLNLSHACLGESASVSARIFAGLMAECAAERGG